MKRIVLIFSAMIFIIVNVGLSQDIINETGKDGKFIVRDAEQQEALIVKDGNVEITGELSVERMPEGSNSSPYVVWDSEDKKFKTVARVFSRVSPLSEPLETKSWHSIGYGEVDAEGNEISSSVQGIAANWNTFTTDNGYIKLGPANSYYAHIYTDRTRFLFNKPLTFLDAKFGSSANQNFQIQTGGTARITIDGTNGNVGIGTNSPTSLLNLHSGSNSTNYLRFNSDASGSGTSDGLLLGNFSSGNSWLWNYENAPLIFGTNDATRMVISAAGNVGIGIADPLAGLHLVGAGWPNSFMYLQANTGMDAGFRLYESTTEKWHIFNDASAARFEIRNNAFDPNFVIEQTSGDVGIGASNPTNRLEVEDNVTDEVARFDNLSTSTAADGIEIELGPDVNPGTSNDYISFFDGNGTYIGYINGNGAGGVNYTSLSDAKLKMNIVDYSNAMDIVSQIKVRKYEMKSAPGIERVGIIAQELQKIYPQVVSGSFDTDEEKPMGIDYGKLTPLLVKAIQELQAEIEILKRR